MHNWKSICRVEILADEVHMTRFEACLAELGMTHWTVRPLARGRQGDSNWTRSGHIVDAGRQAALVVFLEPEVLDTAMARLDPLLRSYAADLYCQSDWKQRLPRAE
ncbi:hypothetical protein [Maricaulis sp.]|uniref:hypothetical protein n=1 Tax=Maricaulis sp. TaxID=1486257 RepID=UPI002B27001E|nr:hypothetical protein [Maricaulis sp.]